MMQIDVFTLFPEAFAWFQSQRHVRNAAAAGLELGYVNYRDHKPLGAGQVDDTPFGGGAGMVLRVDVVEAALRARYRADPIELRARRRVVALTPGGRVLGSMTVTNTDTHVVVDVAVDDALTGYFVRDVYLDVAFGPITAVWRLWYMLSLGVAM